LKRFLDLSDETDSDDDDVQHKLSTDDTAAVFVKIESAVQQTSDGSTMHKLRSTAVNHAASVAAQPIANVAVAQTQAVVAAVSTISSAPTDSEHKQRELRALYSSRYNCAYASCWHFDLHYFEVASCMHTLHCADICSFKLCCNVLPSAALDDKQYVSYRRIIEIVSGTACLYLIQALYWESSILAPIQR
jgi:hypothetical protein